jgi:hypothetical protein
MRLPSDPKERTKVLVLVAFGVVMGLYGVAQGLLSLTAKRAELEERLVDLEWQVSSSRRDVLSAQRSRAKDQEVIADVADASRAHLLHSILGNYRLGVTSILERHAAQAGLELQSVQEVGIMDLPQPSGKKIKNVFKAYAARVVLHCGFFNVIDFLRSLEEQNPYVCCTGLSVAANPEKDPQTHRITLTVQWPIWTDEATEERILSRLDAPSDPVREDEDV